MERVGIVSWNLIICEHQKCVILYYYCYCGVYSKSWNHWLTSSQPTSSADFLAHLLMLEGLIRATFLPNSRKSELFLPWAPYMPLSSSTFPGGSIGHVWLLCSVLISLGSGSCSFIVEPPSGPSEVPDSEQGGNVVEWFRSLGFGVGQTWPQILLSHY